MDSNETRIVELVEKYWGLTPESLELFKSRMSSDREMDHAITDIFGNAVDGRIHFPLSLKHKETIDQGWKKFMTIFREFRSHYRSESVV